MQNLMVKNSLYYLIGSIHTCVYISNHELGCDVVSRTMLLRMYEQICSEGAGTFVTLDGCKYSCNLKHPGSQATCSIVGGINLCYCDYKCGLK